MPGRDFARATYFGDICTTTQQVLKYLTLCLLLVATPALAAAPGPDRAQARYEVFFMQEMIDHHAMAVQMATTCEQKAVHPELQTLCVTMRNTQTVEIMQMQAWLLQWYGISYEPSMSHGHMQGMHRLESLPPARFEIEFMKQMIRHHWMAVVKGSQCVERAYHEELIGLCENIVITQTAEIDLMRTWLCQWYGLCNYGPKGHPHGA